MRTLLLVVAVVLSSGCTAGAVAVQGNGVLVPKVDYEVNYWRHCDKKVTAKTGNDGTFFMYNPNNSSKHVAQGNVCVLVTSPTGLKTWFKFDHQFDTMCPDGNGDPVACSKDLLMLTNEYNPASSNAPGPDVHVRFPLSAQDAIFCSVSIVLCGG